MLIGYARTSTFEQDAGLAAQIRDLKGLGCERIFEEYASALVERGALEAAIEFSRQGDTFVVMKLDRLARSVKHMHEVLDRLCSKSVEVRIENLGIDTSTPTGKLMLNILGGVAQFEREMMLERQREGIERAKAAGRYRGRAPTARAKTGDILRLRAEGRSMASIAGLLGIGKGSVVRVLNDSAKGTAPGTI